MTRKKSLWQEFVNSRCAGITLLCWRETHAYVFWWFMKLSTIHDFHYVMPALQHGAILKCCWFYYVRNRRLLWDRKKEFLQREVVFRQVPLLLGVFPQRPIYSALAVYMGSIYTNDCYWLSLCLMNKLQIPNKTAIGRFLRSGHGGYSFLIDFNLRISILLFYFIQKPHKLDFFNTKKS